jgi:hypothetical protein
MEPTARAEELASSCLRELLEPLLPGAAIAESDTFLKLQSALEYLLPAVLAEANSSWQGEGLDGFRFSVARKIGPDEAEFIGLALLIADQSWTPLHLRLRVSRQRDLFESIDLRLGEVGSGKGGMERTPWASDRVTKLLYSIEGRVASLPWVYAIKRGAPEHAA